MQRVIAIIATAAALAPAAATAQSPDVVIRVRSEVKIETQTEQQRQQQERIRQQTQERIREQQERARAARAEQHRREYREEQTEKTNFTLKIGGSGELELTNLSGDIIVTRGGGSTVQVEALKVARGRTVEEAREMLALVKVDYETRGSRAEVKSVYEGHPERASRPRNINVSVQYTVSAPEHVRISAHSLSGNIRVSGINGDLNLMTLSGQVSVTDANRVAAVKSTSGDVELSNVRSEIAVEAGTVSGKLTVRQSRAPRMELSTVSGEMLIADVNCGRFEAHTTSGSIDFISPLEKNGRYEFNSHAGVVRFAPTGNTGFEVEASSFSGNIESELKLEDTRTGVADLHRRGGRIRSLRGTYGDGSATIEVNSFSGRVIIAKK